MKYAVEDLSRVVKSQVLETNPDLARDNLEVHYLEYQLAAMDKLIMKPYIDSKILKGIGKAFGMEKTGLLDRFLTFDRTMRKIDFYVSFDTWMTAEFCRKRNVTLVTENKAAVRLCGMWNIEAVSVTQFGYSISIYGYEGITVKREY
ncbi:MAG: hypothetical protein RIA63_06085 [Cyclobacteriaceae bacterium]